MVPPAGNAEVKAAARALEEAYRGDVRAGLKL